MKYNKWCKRRPVTTDDLALLVAETRCAHGHLTLDDAERAGTVDD